MIQRSPIWYSNQTNSDSILFKIVAARKSSKKITDPNALVSVSGFHLVNDNVFKIINVPLSRSCLITGNGHVSAI